MNQYSCVINKQEPEEMAATLAVFMTTYRVQSYYQVLLTSTKSLLDFLEVNDSVLSLSLTEYESSPSILALIWKETGV